MKHIFFIDADISKAETLPGWFYHNQELFDAIKEKIFVKTWQLIGDIQLAPLEEMVHPFNLLDGFLSEPMLIIHNQNSEVSCLSNVCTHRGNLVVENAGKYKSLMCLYHGRRYGLDGKFTMMPEFKQTLNFPRPCDHLHQYPLHRWGSFLFTGIFPDYDFKEVTDIMQQRVGFLPLESFKFRQELCKDYLVNAHWALYCDNYLEGFHIPFVHQDLNAVLDYGQYTTLLYDRCSLQIGYASEGEEKFNLPEDHPDYGKNVGAYYFWIFPNMMFNFYPWGLSINIVKPISTAKTKVSFLTYINDESKIHSGAGALLDKVEREDEFVVEHVHKGLKSRVYTTGRFSATKEQGTHHFHRLLAEYLGRE